MLTIDGSMGEGGGQVLRTALGLSMVTGTPFRIERIRAQRRKPGLMRQHLTSVRAATEICGATIEGAEIGSPSLTFAPGPVRASSYEFAVGTAGSTMLVLQAILPALWTADAPSRVTLHGGTHNPMAPPFDFLAGAFAPTIARMGAQLDLQLERPGFYPAGGGTAVASVSPSALEPIEILERGDPVRRTGTAWLSALDDHVGERELKVLQRKLNFGSDEVSIRRVHEPMGPGNVLSAELAFEQVTEVFSVTGEARKPAERVAGELCRDVRNYLASDAPVGTYLADQLLIPLAMAGGGAFRTLPLTRHSQTNIQVVEMFLPVRFVVERSERVDTVTVRPCEKARDPGE